MRVRMEFARIQLALRVALAAVIAFALAELLKLQHPIYAFIAGVIVTDLSPQLSRMLGLTRVAATIIGAIIGAVLSEALGPGLLSLGASVLTTMLVCQVLQVSEGAKVAAYICGLIMIDHRNEPWDYAYQRTVETLLGVVVAWGVSSLPRLIRRSEDEGEL